MQDKPNPEDMLPDAHTELRRQPAEGDAAQGTDAAEKPAPDLAVVPPAPQARRDALTDEDADEDSHDRSLDDLFNDMPV
jgi:hypothetical protein